MLFFGVQLGVVILLILSFGSFISAGLGLAFPFVGLGFWLYFLLWKCNFVAVVHGLGYPLSIPLILFIYY